MSEGGEVARHNFLCFFEPANIHAGFPASTSLIHQPDERYSRSVAACELSRLRRVPHSVQTQLGYDFPYLAALAILCRGFGMSNANDTQFIGCGCHDNPLRHRFGAACLPSAPHVESADGSIGLPQRLVRGHHVKTSRHVPAPRARRPPAGL